MTNQQSLFLQSGAAGLHGRLLNNKWRVVRAIPKGNTTGGYFSYGYIVKSIDGEEAFLKALDLSIAFRQPDFVEAINNMTSAYLFERDLLFRCRENRLTRIVRAIDQGVVEVTGATPPQVHFLVFELAEGDMRQYMDAIGCFDLAWTLRTLHHVTVGIGQLHRIDIAHQDMKPSNVLSFDSGTSAKIADLGRASSRNDSALHDECSVAGDYGYAPPELLYGFISNEWNERRFACDLYHVGSLAMFMFTRVNMTAAISSYLHPVHLPKHWQGAYEEILPRVQYAFEQAMEDLEAEVPLSCRQDVISAVRQLCNPDSKLRGHPLNRKSRGNPYSIERYISWFNRLARKAELGLMK